MTKLRLELTDEEKEKVGSAITRVPRREEEVKRIFFKLEKTLGFEDVRLYTSYPDSTALFAGKEVFIEFEYHSSDFRKHKHDEKKCDLVVCWEDDDSSLNIPVVELSTLSGNWIEAREKAIIEVVRDVVSGKPIEERHRQLMYKFNFDKYDVVAHQLGDTKDWVKRFYGRSLNKRSPECLGGPVECVKRDIELENAGIGSDFMGIAPAVICKDCGNRGKCLLGEKRYLGYIFLFSEVKNKPRRVSIQSIPITDERILSHMKETQYNPWNGIRYESW